MRKTKDNKYTYNQIFECMESVFYKFSEEKIDFTRGVSALIWGVIVSLKEHGESLETILKLIELNYHVIVELENEKNKQGKL